MTPNPYEDLPKNAANYTPLSPLSFLRRTAAIYPNKIAVVHGDRRFTWSEVQDRCHRLASMLVREGIGPGDTVAVMLPNVPAMFEAHFAVPMTGAVLNALNYRLDAEGIAFIFDHAEAKLLITDTEFSPIISGALAKSSREIIVIDHDDPMAGAACGERLSDHEYEGWIEKGDPNFEWQLPEDEWRAISLNYTSGTTGNPKGVVYHHRGAYLNAIGNALTWGMQQHPVYLWTLPMFHCNGWCFPWTMAAVAGTNVCLRRVEAATIYKAFAENGVTHLCGAPIVMQMILGAKEEERKGFDQQIKMMTAAAPPPAAMLQAMAEAGIDVTHVYGLTETYGPATVCAWHDEWDELAAEAKANLKARQGVPSAPLEGLMVADAKSLAPVAHDGEEMGEVFFRGNIVMKGYLKNKKATEEAFRGGWFHSGDLGVSHPDRYIQLKDRSKDIIISGGENISSIEVEDVLYKHPDVAAVAVVAKPHEKWGETPCAFVELKPGAELTEADVVAFCRDNLAHFKCPRDVVFCEVPKTSTGKIKKFVLRDRARGA